MARHILIDNNSGYIWGDSADLDGKIFVGTAAEFARALDESLGETGRQYTELNSAPRDNRTGYHVYRADINGSEAVTAVWDGQDQDTIEAVMRDCRYEGFIEISTTND